MSEEERYDNEEFDEVYSDSGREDLLKNDEIDPQEEAFMAGYESSPEEKEEVDDEDYEKAFEEGKRKKKKK